MALTHKDRRTRRQKILAALNRGEAAEDIAKEHGLSPGYVSVIGPQDRPSKRMSDSFQVLHKLMDGSTTSEIVTELALSKSWVCRIRSIAAAQGIRRYDGSPL